jgi:2-polyprenyl-6-methoxyphenol hydroxylase-like FAD-dependent oxidoreductase
MSTASQTRANAVPVVVVGCGLAGIAAAAALRSGGRSVVLLEQDTLPSEPLPRRGVPQGHQMHNLMACGQIHMEALLPGFGEQLRAAGAREVAVASGTQVFEFGTTMPSRDLGLRLVCAPRPLIEHVARRLLLDRGGVSIRQGVRARQLLLGSNGSATGVLLDSGSRRERVSASLVVDASGVRAEGMRWLRRAELPVPRVDRKRTSRWYVTAEVRRPASQLAVDRSWMIFPTPPQTRAGIVSPAGTNRWYVSLSGGLGDPPPRSWAEMRAYAETLEAPWIALLLNRGELLGDPRLFRRPFSIWHRYDLRQELVVGLLPVGDAYMCLDPLSGQGMSVAAWHASILAESLGEADHRSWREDLANAYLPRAAEACRAAWTLGEVLAGRRSIAEAQGLGALLERNPELHRRYVGAWHLTEPAAAVDAAFAAASA